ncbi:MAG: hypothetical protein ACRDFX_13290, partial [Chloroflexota bacterium]
VHIGRLLGGQQCDIVTNSCGGAAPIYWLPLILLAVATIAGLRGVRACQVTSRLKREDEDRPTG